MRDFTLERYKSLLKAHLDRGFFFVSFEMFLEKPNRSLIIIRHDVDKLPDNSLQTAIIEHKLGIKGTYYFRSVPESFNEKIIRQIAELGHEIGYHYKNLSTTMNDDRRLLNKKKGRSEVMKAEGRSQMSDVREQMAENVRMEKGKIERSGDRSRKNFKNTDDIPSWLFERAIEDFRIKLEKFREIYPVKTIYMLGSPLSNYDNRLLWEKYDYRDFGIIGSPCEIKYL
ncbi:hypothetical protein H8E88_03555 [candidate division KSB1 bacterium]|nr:hypothetical protein [candidate division KSB1 bacterium]MBL7105878.1 hypothetical protein [Bacteroidales bacterium]